MKAYELISADMAARLGLKRLTLTMLCVSFMTNCFLGATIVLKDEAVTTVLVPIGLNESTHPLTVSDSHVDQDYLMLVARDLLSLAMNVNPVNVDFNRKMLLKHAAPSSFGTLDVALEEKASQIKRLRASSYFAVENMDIDTKNLVVQAQGVKSHFIGKTETFRQKTDVLMRFNLIAGKLQLLSLEEIEHLKNKNSAAVDSH